LSRIGGAVSFRNLLRLTALRTAQVLKVSELARDSKLAIAWGTKEPNPTIAHQAEGPREAFK
jgi:hypothetical protein